MITKEDDIIDCTVITNSKAKENIKKEAAKIATSFSV
jgi:hypothetical protein